MAFSYFYDNVSFGDKFPEKRRRPVVPILINGYSFIGLLDSGSDAIVIPLDVAEALSLKEEDKTELCQLDGSSKECSISEIKIEFGKGHENYHFTSKVLIFNSPRLILGRHGFFEHFKITFDEQGGIVHFKNNPTDKTFI